MTTRLGMNSRSTPAGVVTFAVDERGALVALGFQAGWVRLVRRLERRFREVTLVSTRRSAAGDALDAYFAGDLRALDGLAVDPGGTDFQRRVWSALRQIEPGTTCSYAHVARAIGAPRAVRAVGAANGANPVSIVVPCHRVLASDGSLHGYGGGLDRKAWLLAHEGHGAKRSA